MATPADACPSCRAAVPAGARFCPQCGTALRDGTVTAAPEAPPPERRQVAVLFADLSGYTALSAELDPEEVHRLLTRYFELVDGLIGQCGGAIDKHIGDAVMGVFGAPVAYGNDTQRALRAAMGIHAAMAALSAEFGRPLAAHVGVASGEVVAAATGSAVHRHYTVTGDAVNLAPRLDRRHRMRGAGIVGTRRRAVCRRPHGVRVCGVRAVRRGVRPRRPDAIFAEQSLHAGDRPYLPRARRRRVAGARPRAREIGSRRWVVFDLALLAYAYWHAGRRRDARLALDGAFADAEGVGLRFVGGLLLGVRALMVEDADDLAPVLAEGERSLAPGCPAHSHFWLRREAIDAALRHADWDLALRQVAALEALTRSEPVPWIDFQVARGRVLAAAGRGAPDRAALLDCRRRGTAMHLPGALPALDAALAKLG